MVGQFWDKFCRDPLEKAHRPAALWRKRPEGRNSLAELSPGMARSLPEIAMQGEMVRTKSVPQD
jgi:hypothetical protein